MDYHPPESCAAICYGGPGDTTKIHGHSFISQRGKSTSPWCNGTNEARVERSVKRALRLHFRERLERLI
jgi:hypothetical protein